MCANPARCCSASSGIKMVAAICELSDNTNCDMDQFAKFCGWFHGRLYKIIELANFGDGHLHGSGCLLGCSTIQVRSWFLPLTTDDNQRHLFLAKCYQLAQSVLKIGAERVKQEEVGGCIALAYSAWRWSAACRKALVNAG